MEKFNFLLFYSTHYWQCKFYFLLIYSTVEFWKYFKRNMNFWIVPIKLVSTKVKGIWTQWIPQFCTTPNCIKHNNALLSNKNYMSKSIHSTPLLLKSKLTIYAGRENSTKKARRFVLQKNRLFFIIFISFALIIVLFMAT